MTLFYMHYLPKDLISTSVTFGGPGGQDIHMWLFGDTIGPLAGLTELTGPISTALGHSFCAAAPTRKKDTDPCLRCPC